MIAAAAAVDVVMSFSLRRRRWCRRLRAWRLRRRQRLDVLRQREQLLLADLPLKGRHDGREARDDLRCGIENRLANVRLVRDDGVPGRERHGVTEDAVQQGPTCRGVAAVARDARKLREQLLAALGERSFRGAAAE